MRAAGMTRSMQRLRTRQRGALAQCVGGDHMHTAQQPLDMSIGDNIAGGGVYQHIAGT